MDSGHQKDKHQLAFKTQLLAQVTQVGGTSPKLSCDFQLLLFCSTLSGLCPHFLSFLSFLSFQHQAISMTADLWILFFNSGRPPILELLYTTVETLRKRHFRQFFSHFYNHLLHHLVCPKWWITNHLLCLPKMLASLRESKGNICGSKPSDPGKRWYLYANRPNQWTTLSISGISPTHLSLWSMPTLASNHLSHVEELLNVFESWLNYSSQVHRFHPFERTLLSATSAVLSLESHLPSIFTWFAWSPSSWIGDTPDIEHLSPICIYIYIQNASLVAPLGHPFIIHPDPFRLPSPPISCTSTDLSVCSLEEHLTVVLREALKRRTLFRKAFDRFGALPRVTGWFQHVVTRKTVCQCVCVCVTGSQDTWGVRKPSPGAGISRISDLWFDAWPI